MSDRSPTTATLTPTTTVAFGRFRFRMNGISPSSSPITMQLVHSMISLGVRLIPAAPGPPCRASYPRSPTVCARGKFRPDEARPDVTTWTGRSRLAARQNPAVRPDFIGAAGLATAAVQQERV